MDVSPARDLPDAAGRVALAALRAAGIDSLQRVSERTTQELQALHGVGPKAIRVLGEALNENGLAFRET
jgi:endonuclease III